jgi:hypothetical protein
MWRTSQTGTQSYSPLASSTFLSLALSELDMCPCVNLSLVLAISVRLTYRILYCQTALCSSPPLLRLRAIRYCTGLNDPKRLARLVSVTAFIDKDTLYRSVGFNTARRRSGGDEGYRRNEPNHALQLCCGATIVSRQSTIVPFDTHHQLVLIQRRYIVGPFHSVHESDYRLPP